MLNISAWSVRGLCFVSLCVAVCLFSVRHLSYTVILPSSGPSHLTVIPSIYHHVSFSLACCLISLSLSMLLPIMWFCPCSYCTLVSVWSFSVSHVSSAEPGCFLVWPIAQYDPWYTVVSGRVDKGCWSKPMTEQSLHQVVISSSSSFTFIAVRHKHAFKDFIPRLPTTN